MLGKSRRRLEQGFASGANRAFFSNKRRLAELKIAMNTVKRTTELLFHARAAAPEAGAH
jgi:hypothetical protein